MSDVVEFYRENRQGDWRWRYVAENGNILADSGQGYSRRIDALGAAQHVTGAVLYLGQVGEGGRPFKRAAVRALVAAGSADL